MDNKQVFAALVKAQRAFGPALKDRTNPAFKSKYADLGACLDAVMDALNAAGIALVQRQHPHDGGVCVETVFVHESGESYSAGMLTVPASKQDPQGYGSALTYARRYSVMAACGIAPEDFRASIARSTSGWMPALQGFIVEWPLATPTMGFLKSPSPNPTARSMARLGERATPAVINWLRLLSGMKVLQ